MKLHRGYRYRIYPTPDQEARLRQWEGALRFLWNIAHEQRLNDLRRCKVDRVYPGHLSQSRELTDLRAELLWLADVPRNACGEVLKALDLAWQRYFGRLGGEPRFKSKSRDAVAIVESAVRLFDLEAGEGVGCLTFSKIGKLRCVVHRPLDGTPKRATIHRDGDQWFVSVVIEREVPDPAPSTLPPVGIDRGVVAFVATSDRTLIPNPRFGEALRPRIARAQRAVARKTKGSNNQKKARAKVARLQRKARRQREHFLHGLSLDLAKNHGTVVMEKLNVRGMTASAAGTVEAPGTNVRQKAGLNRAILDGGWGRLAYLTRYKLAERGGRFVEVPAQFTSQTCGACGVVDAASRREQDVFLCTTCGHFDHADLNAARVILARGLAAAPSPERARVTLRTTARRTRAA